MEEKKKTPLKKSLSGLEFELFTLDNEGKVVFEADNIIKAVSKKFKDTGVRKECCKSMLELGSFPSVRVHNTATNILTNLQHVIEAAEEKDVYMYPFGTYPGNAPVEMRNNPWYKAREKIMGEERFSKAGHCIGFHYHYTLPRGIFDHTTKSIKIFGRSKIKTSLIDSYNMAIALDPVLTSLTQSSPLYQGEFLGKDSRVIVYRGGKKLRYLNGLYGKYQILGGLSPYKQTLSDLMQSIKRRRLKLKKLLIKNNIDPKKMLDGSNVLDFTWNPVKINKLGTLELRGMDMNFPSYIIPTSVMLKFIFKKIQQDFIHILPSDVGITEPFKTEGNVVYIPAHTHVRNDLQRKAAYEGLANEDIYKYTKRFHNLVKPLIPDHYKKIMRKIYESIESRKSMSDLIIAKFRKKGYGPGTKVPEEVCNEVALDFAKMLSKDNLFILELLKEAEGE